ncbi:trypsin-like serine protease [Lentithecium fluviatile CBS 122367]|uniref:Trypsin-like serine protease n=1 Tax=Lentithecium fluviatile CBS 122367 TaxID=1168545 RepID=A0A6G1J4A4_9PLEO|nr:trypsin-like serine protease [Lentithecium fluviatile CBS 122367]
MVEPHYGEYLGISQAVYWTLTETDTDLISAIGLEDEGDNEKVIGNDNRRLVSRHDRTPGSQKYSIVRLLCVFTDGQGTKEYGHGTGFMIAEDFMITAGHNVYEHYGAVKGPVRAITAYFGHEGNGCWRERRRADLVATSQRWIDGRVGRSGDIAVVRFLPRAQVDELGDWVLPLRPFIPKDIAPRGSEWLTIVGYPLDKSERARDMYEAYDYVQWDLQRDGMLLKYKISTSGGQSGSPILFPDGKTVIGVHVSGNIVAQCNFGCPIGVLGAMIEPYMRFFRGEGYTLRNTEWRDGLWIQHLDLTVP